jgi:hypothetical protein
MSHTQLMRGALRALLRESIDYAGQFPPARLTPEESFRNFVAYLSGPERWIVRRQAWPVAKLEALGSLIELNAPDVTMPVTVIGSNASTEEDLAAALDRDAEAMLAFAAKFEEAAPLEAYEVRLPTPVSERGMRLLSRFRNLEVFAEIPLDEGVGDAVEIAAAAGGTGVKARTGGLSESDFPSSGALASLLTETLSLDVPFKLTAGLHEPMRHKDQATGAMAHGFLNVFAAACMCFVGDLSASEVAEALEETDAGAFGIQENWIAWRGVRADIEAIEATREILRGFGSCSVAEPLDGLRAMGHLAGATA